MTKSDELSAYFEEQFRNYEKNRMYPLGYETRSTMKNLTREHLEAIIKAEFYVRQRMEISMGPLVREELDDVLLRTAEIKRYILDRQVPTQSLLSDIC